jgi:hypothetical protein
MARKSWGTVMESPVLVRRNGMVCELRISE